MQMWRSAAAQSIVGPAVEIGTQCYRSALDLAILFVAVWPMRLHCSVNTVFSQFWSNCSWHRSKRGHCCSCIGVAFNPIRSSPTVENCASGVVDYLTTEISTSRQKRFSLVTFIDTPGLVDGDMKYPYDVNKTILWLGQMADLIFVFFDPIGQALCKRTLNIVEELNDKYVDKMRFYLSKADEAGHEADRQKVMMQIVQELCKRPGLNRCGFDMPAIYIPDASKQAVRCINQIEEVCKEIEKTINQTVQNALNSLERDCEQLSNEVLLRISQDNQARSENLSTGGRGVCLGLFGLALPSLLLLNLALRSAPQEMLHAYLGPNTADFLFLFTLPLQVVSGLLPDPFRLGVVVALFAVSIFILLVAKWQSRLKPILTRQQKRTLLDAQSYLTSFVKPKKQRLYEEYLRQSVADYDL
ncbi:uncharacterized protein LOC144120415 isoform X3 [Amblyomma americanum]